MGVDRVLGPRQHHCDPALSVKRRRLGRLAQHHHPAAAAVSRQRGGQARAPGADDHDIGAGLPAPHPPPPGCPISIIRCTLARASRAISGSTSTSSAPSVRQRSNAAGVIIFMYLHDARSLTARKSTSGAALRSWCSMPTSVATSPCRARVLRAASSMPPVDRIFTLSAGTAPSPARYNAEVAQPHSGGTYTSASGCEG